MSDWQSTMTDARYAEISRDMSVNLTDQELKDGWKFCYCEWDGLLVNINDEEGEGQFCTCHRTQSIQDSDDG